MLEYLLLNLGINPLAFLSQLLLMQLKSIKEIQGQMMKENKGSLNIRSRRSFSQKKYAFLFTFYRSMVTIEYYYYYKVLYMSFIL